MMALPVTILYFQTKITRAVDKIDGELEVKIGKSSSNGGGGSEYRMRRKMKLEFRIQILSPQMGIPILPFCSCTLSPYSSLGPLGPWLARSPVHDIHDPLIPNQDYKSN
ncbi:hypothetical protein BS78_05G138100 [Paspalum vaginatum]|nr:hypothetical protein BS78_05G138100 [Paspalum vaginatum]